MDEFKCLVAQGYRFIVFDGADPAGRNTEMVDQHLFGFGVQSTCAPGYFLKTAGIAPEWSCSAWCETI